MKLEPFQGNTWENQVEELPGKCGRQAEGEGGRQPPHEDGVRARKWPLGVGCAEMQASSVRLGVFFPRK